MAKEQSWGDKCYRDVLQANYDMIPEAFGAPNPLRGAVVLLDIDETVGLRIRKMGSSESDDEITDVIRQGAPELTKKLKVAGAIIGIASSRINRPEGKQFGGYLDDFAKKFGKNLGLSPYIAPISTRHDPFSSIDHGYIADMISAMGIEVSLTPSTSDECRDPSDLAEIAEVAEGILKDTYRESGKQAHEKTIGWSTIIATIGNVALIDPALSSPFCSNLLVPLYLGMTDCTPTYAPRIIFIDDQNPDIAGFPDSSSYKRGRSNFLPDARLVTVEAMSRLE